MSAFKETHSAFIHNQIKVCSAGKVAVLQPSLSQVSYFILFILFFSWRFEVKLTPVGKFEGLSIYAIKRISRSEA